jgi:bifunctional DNA-binding transcriptional regulator/antitoxin component of YhaV-PrlF toxin-antitoxin module
MPPEQLKKGEVRIIDMHLVLDEHGKVHIPQELMEALGLAPGDMLSFHFDDAGVHVKGSKRPSYFHANTETPVRSSHRQPAPTNDLTQIKLFDEASPQQPEQNRWPPPRR